MISRREDDAFGAILIMHNFIPASDAAGLAFSARVPPPAHTFTVKQWTRDFLKLDDEAVVSVSELACLDVGCPLVETVIAVFETGRPRKGQLTRPKAAITKIMVQETLATPLRSITSAPTSTTLATRSVLPSPLPSA